MSTIIRWNPLREMAEMQNTMNRLFDDTWRTIWPAVQSGTGYGLPIDVFETDEGYTVVSDMPGVKQENIHITLNQNVLTLSVEIPQHTPQDGQRLLIGERSYGKFTRSITLPRPVTSDNVEAVYENGVLTLTLPVSPEAQPKRIEVKSNGHLLKSNN
jgi:HSP20 family protein